VIVVSGEIELFLPSSQSLKDKRQVLASIKDRVRSRFDVVAAEIDHQELWQRAAIGLVTVSASARHAQQVMTQAMGFVEDDPRVQVLDSFVEER
jgi:uncharacterized protein